MAVAILDQAVDRANNYLASIGGTPVASTRPAVPAGESWKLTGERVVELRRKLPPPILPSERGTGRKTHGWWVGADGVARSVTSGEDSMARAAFSWLREHRVLQVSASHAEMKAAYHLRTMAERSGGSQHAAIVVNNRVCDGPFGCATLLPVMLPAGCTLTVHAPNYRRTFTGGCDAVITLTLWYSHDQTGDGDVVRDDIELDAALDRVAALSDAEWPALATISRPNDHSSPALYVGFHGDRGALLFVSVAGGREFSRGSIVQEDEPLLYMYMTSAEEFPSNAEVPATVVRRAAHEFADVGQRPKCVEWQTWEGLDKEAAEWPEL